MKLYFLRHGQTYLNKYKKMQGWSDTPLTPEDLATYTQAINDRLRRIHNYQSAQTV